MKDLTITRKARRKLSVLEIIANIIIWLSPIAIMTIVVICNWSKLISLETKYHVEMWVGISLFVMMIVYYKLLKGKIKEKMYADKMNEEKTRAIICLANRVLNLMPYVFALIVFDFLNSLCQPIFRLLLVILICEFVGRLLLFIDSFRESEYTY